MKLEESYYKRRRQMLGRILAVSAGVLLIAAFCLTFGTDSSLYAGVSAVIKYALGQPFAPESAVTDKVIVFLRLPRICLAVLSGVGLAVAGMMMQSVSRNLLVSPFTLGVSSAAAFGASMCIVFGSATIFFNDFFIIGSAFAAAMSSIAVVFLVSRKIGVTANSIILVGIALNYFFAALTASLQFFAQENKLAAVVQWTFGTFNRANWHAVLIVGLVVMCCSLYAAKLVLKWNAMASGDDELVKSLGLNPERLRSMTMFLAVLITAAVISFTGVIGFVGLIAPHIARFIVGNDHTYLFPMSGAVGAALLVAADTLGKFILYPVNVPVGIVVSFIGVPVFIQLILSSRKGSL